VTGDPPTLNAPARQASQSIGVLKTRASGEGIIRESWFRCDSRSVSGMVSRCE